MTKRRIYDDELHAQFVTRLAVEFGRLLRTGQDGGRSTRLGVLNSSRCCATPTILRTNRIGSHSPLRKIIGATRAPQPTLTPNAGLRSF